MRTKWKFPLNFLVVLVFALWVASESHWCAPIRRRAELSCFLLPSTSNTNNKISTLLRLTGTTSKHWYALKSYCVYFCGSSPLLIAIFAFKTVLITLPMGSWKMSVGGHAGPAALNFEINCFSCRCFVCPSQGHSPELTVLHSCSWGGSVETVCGSLRWYPHGPLLSACISLSCISGV